MSAWPWGRSPARAGFALEFSTRARRALHDELAAQWDAFQRAGLRCHFVNAHHHLHVHPRVRRTLVELIARDPGFNGWLRWGRPRFFSGGPGGRTEAFAYALLHATLQAPFAASLPVRRSHSLWGLDRTFAMKAAEIRRVLPSLGAGIHEFMFHPRHPDDADTTCLRELRATAAP